MKKLTFFLLLGLHAIYSIAFAGDSPNLSLVYCPHEIQCMDNGKVESCHLSDNSYELWNATNMRYGGRIVKGVYKFKQAYSYYQNDSIKSQSVINQNPGFSYPCLYQNIGNDGVERLIGIFAKNFVSLEPVLSSASNQWTVVGYQANCFSNSPLLCPLTEQPEISLLSLSGLNEFAFKYYLNENNPNYYGVQATYDRLLSICGATSICKIEVGKSDGISRYINIGSVTVDLSRPDIVHIIGVDTIASSSCTLKKKEPFNVIYCETKEKNIP